MRRACLGMIAVLVCGSAAQAQVPTPSAECPGLNGAKLPTKATFDNGDVTTVLERSEAWLRYETLSRTGAMTTVTSYRGLFTLTTDNPILSSEFAWKQDLSQFVPLKVGQRIVADAIGKTSKSSQTGVVSKDMKVVGMVTIWIGACEYPVFQLEEELQLVGRRDKVVHYYHEPSMLTLKTVITIGSSPPKTDVRQIVKFE